MLKLAARILLSAALSTAFTGCGSKQVLPSELKEKTLSERKEILKNAPDLEHQLYGLEEIAKYYAGHSISKESTTEARDYANQLLKLAPQIKDKWDYGNAIHHGNLVLGRIKLFEGDVTGAKEYLKKAGATPGSPQLNSFGPNMTLAKELLEKGEKKAVLNYFDDCLKFWKRPTSKGTVAEWKASIEKNETPRFGPNLVY
ncbi:MAG: hypothetical protein H7061_09080 [Bdellovibrionaceae bacterium]|nr:hypothetical protein [Bdellovibrio sp.]